VIAQQAAVWRRKQIYSVRALFFAFKMLVIQWYRSFNNKLLSANNPISSLRSKSKFEKSSARVLSMQPAALSVP
jgi:CRP-like cAMP-binding protein